MNSNDETQTVKVSGGLPGDWGVRKADAMTEQRVRVIDKQIARARERKAARDERKKRRAA